MFFLWFLLLVLLFSPYWFSTKCLKTKMRVTPDNPDHSNQSMNITKFGVSCYVISLDKELYSKLSLFTHVFEWGQSFREHN